MVTPSIRIKYTFLSFLQQLFSDHPKYTWNEDPRFTKIIIADKFATDMGIAALRPSIILDRGNISWTQNYRNEAVRRNEENGKTLSGDKKDNYSLTDMLQSSITLNVMDKKPFSADEIANQVFIALSGYREWFKEKGIHKITGLGIGKENLVRLSSADIEVTNVAVSLSFLRQETVRLSERLFNARVYKEGKEIFEGIDFKFKSNGSQVLLHPDIVDINASFTIDYIDAISLEEKTNKNLIPDGQNNRLYTVESNGVVYGYYNIFETFNAEKDNEAWIEEN